MSPSVGARLRANRRLHVGPRRARAPSHVDVVHRSSAVTTQSLPRRRPTRERPIASKSYADGMASPHQPPTIAALFG
ncbi:hypothetical protein DGM85_02045 [Xanthomonas phaseoli pv. phaseoli]|nr:hypothetical protein DGM93_01885 [Xanthomonas phaseoli pv. phaseoli]QWN27493.1 hypothetical protein DGM85_02045 [Xanthomonas phaseoli pv. phaseoli]QWN31640.1 hypothetical protein DGM81_01890 [Xanthomonas phaseoli pv. phaseoli]